jgi:hypothetical protein
MKRVAGVKWVLQERLLCHGVVFSARFLLEFKPKLAIYGGLAL